MSSSLGITFTGNSREAIAPWWHTVLVLAVLGALFISAGYQNGYPNLIAERVRAGLRNTRAKGKRLGRPRVYVNSARIAALRARGASWREISDETGISKGTAQRALPGLPKIV